MKSLRFFLLLFLLIFYYEEALSRKCRKGYAANEAILVVISFDGLRSDYINQSTAPLLTKLRDKIVRAEFESLRFPNSLNVHHTIATGYYPKTHGVFGHEWWNDTRSLDGETTARKLYTYENTQYENDLGKRKKAYPIWTINDLLGGTSACMMWPGCEFRFGPDNASPILVHKFNTTEPYENRLKQVIEWMNESVTFNPPNLVMIYFDQPDRWAHVYGPNDSKLQEQILALDNFTKKFQEKLKQLKLLDRVNIIFVSDHRLTQIRYKDILDIEGMGICTDVHFEGTDVMLQRSFKSRENESSEELNGEWEQVKCWWQDKYDNWHDFNCKKNFYKNSKCIASMCRRRIPDHERICLPWSRFEDTCDYWGHHSYSCIYGYGKSHDYNYNDFLCDWNPAYFKEFPDRLLANFTFFLATLNKTFALFMNSHMYLVFAAYGVKLFPKIENWKTEFNLVVDKCTKFGVHGYRDPPEIGFFMATGPAFVTNRIAKKFQVEDLHSLFAKVLKFKGNFDKDGWFYRVRPILIEGYLDEGMGPINWLQHIKLIIAVSIIHCAVFYIAAEIYLSRKRNRMKKK